MKFRKQFLSLLLAILFSSAASAQTDAERPAMQVYFISMLLKLTSNPTTVKQVHAVVSESSPDRAEDVFLITVRRDYPDYEVIDKLTSPAAAITPPRCTKAAFGTPV